MQLAGRPEMRRVTSISGDREEVTSRASLPSLVTCVGLVTPLDPAAHWCRPFSSTLLATLPHASLPHRVSPGAFPAVSSLLNGVLSVPCCIPCCVSFAVGHAVSPLLHDILIVPYNMPFPWSSGPCSVTSVAVSLTLKTYKATGDCRYNRII